MKWVSQPDWFLNKGDEKNIVFEIRREVHDFRFSVTGCCSVLTLQFAVYKT